MGFDEESINVVEIAKIAEKAGVAAIAIRAYAITNKSLLVSMLRSYQRNGTRGWYFGVNGDIDGPQPSVVVSEKSKAAGVMIGRAAQGHGFF